MTDLLPVARIIALACRLNCSLFLAPGKFCATSTRSDPASLAVPWMISILWPSRSRLTFVGQLLNNLFLAGHHGGQIQTYPAGLDAVGGELFFGQVVVFTGIQQGFAGYAPDIQAHASQARFFFDTGDFQAELGGANRSHISAGTTSDNDDVIVFILGHFKSPS